MTISNRAAILMEIATEAQTNPEYWKEFEITIVGISWKEVNSENCLLGCIINDVKLRRKPFVKPTRKIGDYDVPYPVQEPLQVGEKYWLVDLKMGYDNHPLEYIWEDDSYDRLWLERGIIFETKDDANCLKQALLSITRVGDGEQTTGDKDGM